MRLPQEFLEELRARNDIEEVIGRYTDVKHRGSRTPVCLCPFHSEKTPSFVIYRDTSSYYCFGCGAGGDVITFTKTIERLDYYDAVKLLAERSGLSMPEDKKDDASVQLRRRCYAANREAARFYNAMLKKPEGKAGADYFRARQLSQETITHFGLGYAPDKWDDLVRHLRKLGYTDNELVSFYLARQTRNGGVVDAFRNRVMFPIIDLRGNVIAFGGRVLDDSKPKYLNTSDTIVFKKSQGLYALNFAKNANDGKLILCEGYMDVIAMHQAGFTNAVAGLGTAFTSEQASLLSRYCTELSLCFDSDEAGVKATNRAIGILEKSNLKLRVIKLTGGKDADEIIKKNGTEYMRRLIEGAANDTEFALANAKSKYDVSTDDGKLGYMNEATAILAAIPNEVERDLYTTRLSLELGIKKEAAEAQIKKQKNYNKRAEDKKIFSEAVSHLNGSGKNSPNPQFGLYPKAARAEEILLATLLKSPDFLPKLGSSLSEETFITDYNRRFFSDISQRIKEGRPLEMYEFSSGDDSDTAYISYLLAKKSQSDCSLTECDACIGILVEERTKMSVGSVSALSDDEYMLAFRKRAEQLKNGGKYKPYGN